MSKADKYETLGTLVMTAFTNPSSVERIAGASFVQLSSSIALLLLVPVFRANQTALATIHPVLEPFWKLVALYGGGVLVLGCLNGYVVLRVVHRQPKEDDTDA